ncbi:non-ribosomal peptide synthetase [Pseudoduganella flava]|nr:non-ribosomal peptide synthetase [Pseudoduganella flava]
MLESLTNEHATEVQAGTLPAATRPADRPAHFVHVVQRRAAEHAHKVAFTFLKDGEEAVASLTYGELDARARAIAAALRTVAAPGERALLMFPDGLDFVLGFLGCLYAGVIAVPVYPPHARTEYWHRLEGLAADCDARHVLCISDYAPELARHSAGLATLERCACTRIDDLPADAPAWQAPAIDADTLAFLQYTSGSTSLPKGVMVTHRCLLDNMEMMRDGFGHDADSVLVSWLPMFHDMGLIGNVLQTIHVGGSCYVMAPAAFIQNPMRWLRAISTYRGTSAFAPNFAYELCAQRGSEEDLRTLDLSSWGMALNGAEPVRYDTLRRFADKYAPCGFDARSLYPAYGLAEATLFVSGGGRGTGVRWYDADAEQLDRAALVRPAAPGAPVRRLVGCGRAWHGTALRIVDGATGAVCADGVIGEIWIGNDSVAHGYWGRDAETARTFGATPQGETGCYLRTGDLGFLHEGELYVTGRVKELIILRGVNYYPHDIERAVQDAVPALKAGAGAAFAIETDGAEQLVLVQEVERTHLRTLDHDAVFAAARAAVLRTLGVAPHAIVLIRPATLAKTSSGKIQRQLMRSRFLDGSLAGNTVAERRWQLDAAAGADVDAGTPADAAGWTRLLRTLAARQLRVHPDEVDSAASPVALGLDSLAIAGMQHAVQASGGAALPLALLLGDASLAALGEHLAAQDGAAGTDHAALAADDEEGDAWPMSDHQRQLWLLRAQAPDNAAYHVPLCLQGRFEAAPLRTALATLLERHPVLRAAYRDDDGEAGLHVLPAAALPLTEVETDGGDGTLTALLAEACARPLALERGEVCRVVHYRASAGLEHLLFVFHHIAVDLRSVQCLVAEFGDLYCAAAAGDPAPPARPDPGYRRFVASQAAHANSAHGRAAREYWQGRLAAALPVLQLPTEHNRPPLRRFRGGSVDFAIDARLGGRLRLTARRHGVTAGSLLLAAWQLLLGRMSAQDEVVTGVPMAGRHLPGFDNTVGYFVEPAVIHTAWQPELPFAALAQGVHAALAAALDHQGGVLDALHAAAGRHPDRSVPPVFQALYTYYPATATGLQPFHGRPEPRQVQAGALTCALRPLPSPGAQLDVALLVADGGTGFGARIEYDADLFDAAAMRRCAARLLVLLTALADDPDASAGELALLPDAERDLVLRGWNDTACDYGDTRTIHGIIGERAAAQPHLVATRCDGAVLTYGELAQRSDALAALLAARGVGPDDRVGICLHRSLPLLVGLLAILKAGAAYVPVDPDYPPERLARIGADAGLSLVLTTSVLADAAACAGAPVVCVDTLDLDAPVAWTAPLLDDAHLAYVIFTSGSTGRPKGVMNTHGAIRNRLLWMQELGRLRVGEPVLQKTPFSFDVSVWEFFWPLMTGATVVFARPGGHLEADYLDQVLRDEAVTTLHFVPSMLQAFLEHDGAALPALRQVFCSGEELPADLARRFLARYPGVALHNLYGPTEAAVDVSHWHCTDARARVPIGRPIANTQLYVLDSGMRPVGIGVTGELYIGGAGLARGYLGRPDVTAERFVPDPFSAVPGARLYRTGDLARWRADGALEYLGRTDHQVKLRGLRIELGDVEAALTRLPGVREAVALVRGDGAHKALVAYVAGDGLDPVTLRAGLEQALPAYMVPAALQVLAALPLTPNGKVDRAALPALVPVRGGAGRVPRTPRERALAEAWCEVLGCDTVGLDDSFFELGGHSLLAARLVARLRAAGLGLTVRDVFEAPTIAGQVERAAGVAEAVPALLPVARDGAMPLSYAQQRLWFLAQLEGITATYNMPHAVRLHGALDIAALRTAIEGMVARHEVLRTVYAEGPRQEVLPADAFTVGWEDWSGHTDAGALAARAEADSRRGFDLRHEPPLRVTVIRLAPDEHALLLCLHHIAGDGWSIELLWRELEQGYAAALAGTAPPAAPALQYIDYACWQREWLAGERGARQLDYWRGQLDGLAPLLELPTDRARPAARRHAGASLPVAVPAELLPALRALGHEGQASLFMTLLAVFQLVLARYSGQDDIAVGSPVANRPRAELDGLIGFFANTLVLRTRVDRTVSFRTLLAEVRETTLAAHEHQDLPFEQLVEALQPARSLSYSPLFQVMFNLLHGAAETIALPQVKSEVLPAAHHVAKFDLTLTLQERGGSLAGTLEYDVDLFEEASVARLWRHYVAVLEHVLAAPDTPLQAMDLLGATERAELAAWNATAAPYPDTCLHTLFEAQAARTPDAIALVCDDAEVSYAALNGRANALAQQLQALGVRPEETVGVCLPRSVDVVVALLAVLKAGGAYLPLDASLPLARLAQLKDQAGLRLAIGTAGPLAPLGLQWLAPEQGVDAVNPGLPGAPDQLAYVMFTSGSTGVPKGILTTHRGIVRLLAGTDYAQFGPGHRVLHAAPLAFDASTFEIWGALLHGGTCVLYPEQVPTAPELAAFIGRHRVDTAWLTSALFNQLVDEDPDCLRGLRQLLVGGDIVSAAHVRRVYAALPDVRITNGYGPTESTTFAACHPIARDAAGATVPIGRPIANTQLYVLDGSMQPVGIGVNGELYIGGAGLARGYLGRPDLTAERFVPDPFATIPGARLYRTGDLARWRADGALEYLGRTDHQVKLRGLRIELGDVEAALTRLPGVREAVALVRGDGAHKALVAYVAGDGLDPAVLRAGLEQALPAYMVPAALQVLDMLPLTPNGKVDRAALPALVPVRGGAGWAPRTPRERALAEAWCEVLGCDTVGLDDSFFELGGHSLLAARLVARLRAAGLGLTVRDVFEAPTIAGQVERAAGVAEAGPALLPVARDGAMPLSYAQQRLWFLAQLEGITATYNMPHAVRLHGALDVAALRTAIEGLVARHEVLRTVYAEGPRQVVLPADAFTVGWEDWSGHADAGALAARAEADSRRGFDLRHEPPLRVTVIRLAPDDHALLLCLHHIAGDGWSIELLWRELEQGYAAALAGTAPPAAPALQYIDYACWQREWLAGERGARQLDYWRRQLDGLPPLLELPTDRARPAARRHAGASLPVAVPAELLPALRALGHDGQASLFMTLLAVFQLVLARYSGQDDIAVGSPVANRPRAELDGLIGFFANTLVLRTRVDSAASFRTLLAAVRETTLAAHEHQDLPFEQLVEALQPARSLSYSPLFQVMFNLLHGAAETIALPQVKSEVLPATQHVAKFDLTLTLQERGGSLAGTLEYDVDLFDAASVARLWRHYVAVLEHVLAAPDTPLQAMDLLGAAERAELAAWNATAAPYPDTCLHTLFEAQAARTPDAIALVCDDAEVSYAALNGRANALAQQLRALGVRPEDTVGVCLPRTADLVVALLAVLKAGGAYVPLDPHYPDGRLAHIADSARPAVVLVDGEGAQRLTALVPAGTRVALVDAAHDPVAPAPLPATLPGQLAYVIYTSGSTGRPKGVAITHANAVAMLAWARQEFDAEALRCVLASTSICFDLSVFELFLPLVTGHTVLLVRDALVLAERPPARPVTLVNTVPSAMEALLAADALPASVRVVNLAGEALARSLVDKLHARDHVRAVYNLYGPSEDTTYSTGGPVERGGAQPPTIGRPLHNTRAYVLDAALRPVPPGAPGELYLAGCGVSRGYLGQPALTAERYVPNPHATAPGERLYRTGDLVRHLHDGRLAYLGRADHQVKLRGFRIELGEIESVLVAAGGVRTAVAVVRPLGDGVDALVAFVEPDGTAPVTSAGLRRALAGQLPEYMVPTRIVTETALPLTQNGKIDRKALSLLPLAADVPDFDPPVSETEQRLAHLWCEVLGLKRVGRHDDFFSAGGHSLLATALNARMPAAFGVATAVRDIFLYPRLADQAERIDNLCWAAAAAERTGGEQASADDLDVGVL